MLYDWLSRNPGLSPHVGALENELVKVREWLAVRARHDEPRANEKVLALMALNLAKQANEDLYTGLLRDAYLDRGLNLKAVADWSGGCDKGDVSSMGEA